MPTPRRQKIVLPGVQLRVAGAFVGLAALALVVQFAVLGHRLVSVLEEVDGVGDALAGRIPAAVVETLVFSCGVLLPVLFVFSILITYRVAGPLHRLEGHLRAVARGEHREPCALRAGDPLRSLAEAVEEVSAELRAARAAAGPAAGSAEAERAA